jgi:hypothetical protein
MRASLRITGFHPSRLALNLFLSGGLRRCLSFFPLSPSLLGTVRLGRLFSWRFKSVSGGWWMVVRVRLPCVGGFRVLKLGGSDTTLHVLVLVLMVVPEAFVTVMLVRAVLDFLWRRLVFWSFVFLIPLPRVLLWLEMALYLLLLQQVVG